MAEKDRDKIIPLAEQFNKKDLEVILEVNRKVIEIETDVADQNEEIIGALNDCKKKQEDTDKKVDKLLELAEDTSKDLFKIQVLFVTGLLALVAQIVQIFLKK